MEKTDEVLNELDNGKTNGQSKCPKCGATDVSLSPNKGKLVCNFCRHEFEPEKVEGMEGSVEEINEDIIGVGAEEIIADTNDMITLKCTSCGAEVIIDTNKSTQSRCHWCRNTLSINEQVPNGAVPDVVLPFKLKKEQAQSKIKDFVSKRQFYANPTFKKEFTIENINGVYFPYFIVDVNANANLSGEAEIQTRSYTVGSDEHKKTKYDADYYQVSRQFDIEIDNLTVESSKDKLDQKSDTKTTNIINAIMPFDIENCVKWDANYIKGYTSEKRDANTTELDGLVNAQSLDIAKFKALESMKQYDRGVAWKTQEINVKGKKWIASYLPVWLYSYMQHKGNGKNELHYVAVNARTQETMGSVPLNRPKLVGVSIIVAIISFIAGILWDLEDITFILPFIAGIGYYIYIASRYRNSDARHTYEKETKAVIKNLQKSDKFIKERKRLNNSRIEGENGTSVNTKSFSELLKK